MGVAVEACWTNLDVQAGRVTEFLGLLDVDERARAHCFRFERDYARFVLRRGRLRLLLAGRVGEDPAALRFTRNRFGKPRLCGSDLHFSASHSHGVALYVFARDVELGCDIERYDERIDIEGIARLLFTLGEVRMLERLPPKAQRGAFFRCWTRKEACVKGFGQGLSHRLDAFSSPSPKRTVAGWTVESFKPQPLYYAAVAAKGESLEFTLRPC